MKNSLWQYILLSSLFVVAVGCRSGQETFAQQNLTKAEKTPTNNSAKTNSLPISNGEGYALGSPFTQNSQSKGKYLKSLKTYLTGAWKKNEPTGCYNLWIEFPVAKNICIADNHLYADLRYKLDTKKQKVYLYFDRTASLSEAAMKTPWQDIDKDKPIAIIDISEVSSSGLIKVEWLGFVNKKTGEIYDYGKEDHEGIHRKQRDDE